MIMIRIDKVMKKTLFFIMLVMLVLCIPKPASAKALNVMNTAPSAATLITINKSTASCVPGQKLQLKISGTSSAVKWSSSDKTIATVDSNGLVKMLKTGSVTITAKIGTTRKICKITVSAPKFGTYSSTVKMNESQTLTIKNSGVTPRFYSSDTNKLYINNTTGKMYAKNIGSVYVTVKINGITAAKKKITIIENLKLGKTSVHLIKAENINMYLSGAKTSVKWSSTNTAVATVSSTGRVSAVGPGTAKIIAKTSTSSVSCTVTVEKPSISIVNKAMNIGDTQKISIKNSSYYTPKFTSMTTDILSVSSTGVITAKKAGTGKIQVRIHNTPYYVSVKVVSPYFNKEKFIGSIGDKTYLYISNAGGITVKWSTTDTSVATVDTLGNLTLVGAGSCKAVAKIGTKTLSIPVTVNPQQISATTANVYRKSNLFVNMKNVSDNDVITWTSSNESIATVVYTRLNADGTPKSTKYGRVVGVREGTVTITAKSKITGKTFSCVVKVYPNYEAVDLNVHINKNGKMNSVDLKPYINLIDPAKETAYTVEMNNPYMGTVNDLVYTGKIPGVGNVSTGVNTVKVKYGDYVIYFRIKNIAWIAHRGATSYAPENTLASLKEAANHGAFGMETDIRATQDGVLVCYHDGGTGCLSVTNKYINKITYDELCRIPITNSNGTGNPDSRVMTLTEYLNACKEYNLFANIELKSLSNSTYSDEEMYQKLEETLINTGYLSSSGKILTPFIITSLSAKNLYDLSMATAGNGNASALPVSWVSTSGLAQDNGYAAMLKSLPNYYSIMGADANSWDKLIAGAIRTTADYSPILGPESSKYGSDFHACLDK
ncbi:MAG: Ig-like domain-containing protein [Clostridia bacterium]|nr:Ig-like domain-containing protein [Clostridia bacterium]